MGASMVIDADRILVVDDDELVLRALTRMLRRAGHVVVARVSLEEARAVVASGEIDAVVTDYRLRDGTGLELARELRRSHPHMRVLVLTGDPAAMLPGVSRLDKPVSASELLEALHAA